jgi:hypothetical protein
MAQTKARAEDVKITTQKICTGMGWDLGLGLLCNACWFKSVGCLRCVGVHLCTVGFLLKLERFLHLSASNIGELERHVLFLKGGGTAIIAYSVY